MRLTKKNPAPFIYYKHLLTLTRIKYFKINYLKCHIKKPNTPKLLQFQVPIII